MLTSDDLLYSYLRLLHDLSQAEAVSIYLPAIPEVPDSSLLLHASGSPAVPELADAEAASRLPDAVTSPVPRGVASQAPAGMLIPVHAEPLRDVGIPLPGAPTPEDEPGDRRPSDRDPLPVPPAMWIGLRLSRGAGALTELGSGTPQVWPRVLELGAALSHYRRRIDSAQRDPLSGHADQKTPPSREVAAIGEALEEVQLVYRSPRMEALVDTIRRVAPTDAGVLVTGESGTGKELVARTVHALSPRRRKPLVVVDCAAISASLIDSELFGHERGAYTGAAGRTVGRLAEAAGSTLILDEIGELPLEVQAKLLRFVQEKQITPVGGTRPRTVDVRLVAVTNRDLEDEVAAGRFRQDLYYRLKVIHLEVPALVERPEDVPLLMDYYIRRFSTRYSKKVDGLSSEAAALAARHSWPGNVRELENRILQAVILCEGDEIVPQDLDLIEAVPVAGPNTLDLDLGQLEKRHIERVLESEDGSVARAARRLGIQRSTLYQKIKKYGLER